MQRCSLVTQHTGNTHTTYYTPIYTLLHTHTTHREHAHHILHTYLHTLAHTHTTKHVHTNTCTQNTERSINKWLKRLSLPPVLGLTLLISCSLASVLWLLMGIRATSAPRKAHDLLCLMMHSDRHGRQRQHKAGPGSLRHIECKKAINLDISLSRHTEIHLAISACCAPSVLSLSQLTTQASV